MGQQFVEFVDGVVGNATEHVAQPDERIDFDELAGGDEASKYCRWLTAIVTAEESPVAPPDSDAADRTFGGIIVDRKIAVIAIARQRLPVLQRVCHCLSGVAFGQDFVLNLD